MVLVYYFLFYKNNTQMRYFMICLRTTAHAGSIDALPPTTRWHCHPIMRRHPRGHLDRLNRQHPMARASWVNCHHRCRCSCHLHHHCRFPQFLSAVACCRLKSLLTTNGGCHWRPLRRLWHKRVLRILRAAQTMAPLPMSFGASLPLYSLCRSVHLRSMGGGYTPMAWPTMPSEGAP
jgi:hypothetical protein